MRQYLEIDNLQRWSRFNEWSGFAHSWSGWAWIYLELIQKKIFKADSDNLKIIEKRILRQLSFDDENSSMFIGKGAMLVLLAKLNNIKEVNDSLALKVGEYCSAASENKMNDLMMGMPGQLIAFGIAETYNYNIKNKVFLKKLHKSVLNELESFFENPQQRYLGLSHGLAGVVLSLEYAESLLGIGFNNKLRTKYISILEFLLDQNNNLLPTYIINPANNQTGLQSWCHGTPGVTIAIAQTLQLGHSTTYSKLLPKLISGNEKSHQIRSSYCCGSAGKAEAFLELYLLQKQKKFLQAARSCLESPGENRIESKFLKSFHHGELGRYYTHLRLAKPSLLRRFAF